MSRSPSQPQRGPAPSPSAEGVANDGGLESWLADTRRWVDLDLERSLAAQGRVSQRLHEAMRYAVFGRGKRLRPALVRALCAHHSGDDAHALAPAVAIECVHTYSLVHDDLPCMDDDDLRRGRPTCHKVFGEALAVLTGDALLTLAFAVVSRAEPHALEMVRVLGDAAGPAGMVGGQALDLGSEAHPLTRARVDAIHATKTAALIGAAAEMGAIAGGAALAERALARGYGLALGRAFQAMDDILDVTGDAATLGKTPGKDAHANKPTLVALLGLAGAREESERLSAEARRAAEALGAGPGDRPYELVSFLLRRRS